MKHHPTWEDRAACRQADPHLFFPFGNSINADNMERQAKHVCAGCPVLVECLQTAISRNEAYGIWGGKNPQERWRIRRRLYGHAYYEHRPVADDPERWD